MTKITLDSYALKNLFELKEHECLTVYDDNGLLGYLEKDTTGDIEIKGMHFTFNYYQPLNVSIYLWIDDKYINRKRIGGN